MNKIKILSLLLCFALLAGILTPGAFALEAKAADTPGDSGTTAEGIEVNKTAAVDEDGNYTITLEAYATGSKVISTESKDMPTDIVLVLDESGSMKFCIVCGNEMDGWDDYHYSYTEPTTINNRDTYYIKRGSSYIEVYHCSGTHSWYGSEYQCKGGEGWYTSKQLSDHTASAKITPKINDSSEGVEFYTRTLEKCTPRLKALKDAAKKFVNNVEAKATESNIDHRIAVVGFASGAYNYTAGLKDMTKANEANQVKTAIENLAADGGTQVDDGIRTANGIFEDNPINPKERNRVVIVFTDGAPGTYGNWRSESVSTANSAIDEAYKAKNTHGATVYSVGVFSGADASNPGSLPSYTKYTSDRWGNESSPSDADQIKNSNRFMHLISSNYLEATSITTPGTINPKLNGSSYYLSAGDAESLSTIFQKISDQIESGGSSTTLGSETVIKDIVAPAFDMPENPSGIKVYTAASNGSTTNWHDRVPFTGSVTLDTENSAISVSGFSFKDNWCGTETKDGNVTFHNGEKLIIEFTVTPKAGFLGGNNVFTNTSAGVYENANAAKPVVTFPRPQVNVPIKEVTVAAENKNVYLLGDLTAEQIKSGATVKCGTVTLDLSKATDTDKPYGLDPWQTEYVDITVTVKDKDGNSISDKLENLTEDTTYTVEVTVSPKTEGTSTPEKGNAATAKTGINDPAANIYVFKPELTFRDSAAYYGETVPTNKNYSGNQVGTEKWMHDGTAAVPSEMLGEKPTLDISYTPDESKLEDGKYTKQDVPVAATVKIGTENVNEHTTFVHQDCTTACGWETPATPGAPAFLIHIQTCQLTITKTDGASGEPYVFTVKKDGTEYSEVTIVGNGNATIVELPVGTYSIEEDTGWSWRYNPTYGNSAGLTAQTPTGTITCTNSNSMPYWLNGYSDVVTNIFGFKH